MVKKGGVTSPDNPLVTKAVVRGNLQPEVMVASKSTLKHTVSQIQVEGVGRGQVQWEDAHRDVIQGGRREQMERGEVLGREWPLAK